jgi:hypothetical protein|tara:strand:+ start:209 stop:409 length:201 start_codon:yes stop_codon:yes gene_type:complete
MKEKISISQAVLDIETKTTEFVFEQLIDIIDWQLDEEKYQDLNVEDFEEIKRLVMKSITENIYKRL